MNRAKIDVGDLTRLVSTTAVAGVRAPPKVATCIRFSFLKTRLRNITCTDLSLSRGASPFYDDDLEVFTRYDHRLVVRRVHAADELVQILLQPNLLRHI